MIKTFLTVAAVLVAATAWAVQPGQEAFDRGDFDAAIAELLPLAEAGDAEAQYWLGRSYDAMDRPARALEWFRKAAEQDHDEAQLYVGIYHEEGRAVGRSDLGAACWYRAAAESGNDEAQRYLGLMLDAGRGVARDSEQAAYWLKRAAESGNPAAQRNLAHMYYFGVGVAKDRAKAMELYTSAASSGETAAKADLGKLYYRGKDVPRDLHTALVLFTEAAAAGNITAQYYLGRMLAEGEGVEQDRAEAYFWLMLAANAVRHQEDPNPHGWRAHEWLARIGSDLDQAQIQAARDRVHAWRAR